MSTARINQSRRQAREFAAQFLYQWDINRPESVSEALDYFWKQQEAVLPVVRDFANDLIQGTIRHHPALDEQIARHLENWTLDRVAAVDRNILRLALFEMHHRPDIPPVVSINEAIEIAKRFSTDDSGRFINGILDRAKADLLRPARTPSV